MQLKKWEELPDFMKCQEVRSYYDRLLQRKNSLLAKRLFDIVMSLLLLVVLAPIFLVLSILIRLDSKGPIFYRQERITQYGKTFKIYKFRTMVVDADKVGSLVTTYQDSRITNIGSKIRKYRIDELPQLINILKGEMTFVGTRPEVKKYVDCYSNEMKATLLLPAGVTSLASLKYRDEDEILKVYISKSNSIDEAYVKKVLPEKMVYNLEYMKSFVFFEDIRLCVKTIL